MNDLPKEAKEKLDAMKEKLDKFSKTVTKENKEIIGIALLPPTKINPEEKLPEEELKKIKNAINIMVLVNLIDVKNWFDVREALTKKVIKKATEIDQNLNIQVMDIYDIRESCFDGKTEILALIAASAPIYDPKDLLGALKIAEVHKNMVLKKFEKYIVSYVAVGSLFRGDAKPNDIDVAVVVDDTDVKKMTRAELKDKLGAIVRSLGYDASKATGVEKAFHIQTYILTDFWDSIKDAHPVIYTFLRDGVPIYDRGVFMPWKLLLKMGRIKPSPEAIDMQMDIGEKLIQRTKGKLLSVVGEDLYYAILNPAQAALMLYGIAPPTPKETIQLMEEIFVKKEKLLEKKYVDILDKIRDYYKDIEHGDVKEVSGNDVDKLLKDAEDYLKRIKKLFDQIQARRDKESVEEMHQSCLNVTEEVLKIHNIPVKNRTYIESLFKKEILAKKHLPEKLGDSLKTIVETKEKYGKKKIPSPELEKIRKEARAYIKTLLEYVQRKRGYEFERAKLRFKYGDKYGEAILLDKVAFLVDDIDAEEKQVQKAILNTDGSLGTKQKSSLEEMEKELASIALPTKVFIKEKIFEDLRSIYGKDIEILINY
ncbi:MAG TPA: HEPN domain-containing protein [Candidatus Nanoarchaeia archaeon]|nr:HEPN domain-containing protein [Candidatus Nanoarchaeia archaeon]